MKKIILSFLVALCLPLMACAQEKYHEGTHYKVIAEQATEKKEVLEFFSFWCPHCFNFEPIVNNIKTKLADDVEFKKVHVNFMGFTSTKIQDDATRAMMIGHALKNSDALNQAIFSYIHVSRSTITGLTDLKNIFVVNGVEPDEFDKTAVSPDVDNMLKMNNEIIKTYKKHINSVPNFIVNGKYQSTFTRDMTTDDIADLIVFLSNKK
jgi:thiol:disulfide interchange protein DsbA